MDAILAVEVVVELGRGKAQKVGEDEDAVDGGPEVQRIGSSRRKAVSGKPLTTMWRETQHGVKGGIYWKPQRILPSMTVAMMTLGVT